MRTALSGKSRYSLLICVLLILVAGAPNPSWREAPSAVKGQLDLTQWNFDTDGPVKLSGEWEFHWEKILSAGREADRGAA